MKITTAMVLAFSISVSIFTTPAHSAFDPNCGGGAIQEIVEGGSNEDALYIKFFPTIYPTNATPAPYPDGIQDPTGGGGWLYNWWVRFDGLSKSRSKSIRDLAYLALSQDVDIKVHSHVGDCGAATELIVNF